jgi:hypothetical protein
MERIKKFRVFESEELSYRHGNSMRRAIRDADFPEFKRLVNEITDDSRYMNMLNNDRIKCLQWSGEYGLIDFMKHLFTKFDYSTSEIEHILKWCSNSRKNRENRDEVLDLLRSNL